MGRSTIRTVCLVGVVVLLGSGCSGIFNPHVSWKSDLGKSPDGKISLTQAIEYADNAKGAYRDALGNQAKLNSWLGTGLVPLMAAATGLGIAGASPNAVAGTTLTGVAAYGVGQWLISKPNQRAWVVGYNATSCAITAVIPLLYVEEKKKDIERHINEFDCKKKEVRNKMGLLTSVLSNHEDKTPKSLVEDAKKRLDDAQKLLTSVDATRSNAQAMLYQASTAAYYLKEAVDDISNKVSAVLVETAADLQALVSIVTGLAPSYRTFSSIPEQLKPPTKTPQPKATDEKIMKALSESDILKALNELEEAMRKLVEAHQVLADDVSQFILTTPIEKLRSCGVSADQISIPLSIDPAGPIAFDQGTEVTKGRIVKGGSSPYSITLQGELTGLVVQQTELFGPAFTVRMTKSTPEGEVPILVADRSGNKLFVPVTVGSKDPIISALKAAKEKLEKSPNSPIKTFGDIGAYIDGVVTLKEPDKKLSLRIKFKKGNDQASAGGVQGIQKEAVMDSLLTFLDDPKLKEDNIEITKYIPDLKN